MKVAQYARASRGGGETYLVCARCFYARDQPRILKNWFIERFLLEFRKKFAFPLVLCYNT